MKKILVLLAIMASTEIIYAQPKSCTIIPVPAHVTFTNGQFILKGCSIAAKSAGELKLAGMLNYFLKKRYGLILPINNKAARIIKLNILPGKADSSEAYKVQITPSEVRISGSKAGVFYGIQSVLQTLNNQNGAFVMPAMDITDAPAFAYRGLMLDVARHFFPVDEVKKILDVMAYFKLNRLHWHLTDDQGCRLEIKKYPLLAQVSAWRDSSMIGSYGDHKPFVYDGQRSGGFYTQQQAREVVEYAAERNIEVIPEIEMPGHSTAVLAAYPQFGNDTTKYHVPGFWGVHATIYNPGQPTITFLKDVLTEVMAIFPSKYIHIGGDEVPKTEWKTSALAQRIIKEQHLKDENELQSWFIGQIEPFLNQHGRNLIGWDEILEGGLARNATVMSWRGEEGGIEAAKQGHHVIMTPGGFMYLDQAQSNDKTTEPLTIGGFLPLSTVYNYNPLPAVLTVEQQQYILGVQGNMWTEYIPTAGKLEYMLFPRMIALAEVGWSKPQNKDFDNFTRLRLPKAISALDSFGLNYRIPEAAVNISDAGIPGRKKIVVTPFLSGCKIFYTLDGRQADNTALHYNESITTPYVAGGKPVILRYVIYNSAGRSSAQYTVEIK
jgi:hexosaminidase